MSLSCRSLLHSHSLELNTHTHTYAHTHVQAHVRLCLCNLLAASLNSISACVEWLSRRVCVFVNEWLSNCRLQLEANYNCLIWHFLQQQQISLAYVVCFCDTLTCYLFIFVSPSLLPLHSVVVYRSQLKIKVTQRRCQISNWKTKSRIQTCVRKCVCVYCVSLFVSLFVLAKILSANVAAAVRSNLHWRHREQNHSLCAVLWAWPAWAWACPWYAGWASKSIRGLLNATLSGRGNWRRCDCCAN